VQEFGGGSKSSAFEELEDHSGQLQLLNIELDKIRCFELGQSCDKNTLKLKMYLNVLERVLVIH
jgi:hypothetical protein